MPKTPTWKSITVTDEYQSLSPESRSELKASFFNKHILPVVDEDEELKSLGRQNLMNWFMEQPDDSGQGRATSLLGSAGRGFGEVVPGVVEGVGALTGSDTLREGGQSIREGLQSISPVNPIYEEDFSTKATGAAGQAGSMFFTGGAGGVLGKALGGVNAISKGAKAAALGSAALQGAASGAQEAERYGMTGPAAYARTLAGAVTETVPELLPFGTMVETAAARRLLGESVRGVPGMAKSGLSEAAEGAVSNISGNVATTALAPEGVETPGMFDNTLEAAALEGIGGVTMGGINNLITSPDDDFAKRAALEGATQYTPPVQAVEVPAGNGTVIKAGAPATITPEFLEDLPEGDLIELEKIGHISRPPPITPLPGASAAEQAVFDDAALNVLEAGSTVSATAEAAREADVLEESPAVETPAENTAATSEDQSEVAGSGVPSKPAEGSIPAVEGIIPQEEVVSSTEVEQVTPEETVAETATVPDKVIHYSRKPLKLSTTETGEQYNSGLDSVFGFGTYASAPENEQGWVGMDRLVLGKNRNELDFKPKKPLIVSPQNLPALLAQAVKEGGPMDSSKFHRWLATKTTSGEHDAIVVSGFGLGGREGINSQINKRVRELWTPQFPAGKTSGAFTNGDEYDAALEQATQEIAGTDTSTFEVTEGLQDQVFVPPQHVESVFGKTPNTEPQPTPIQNIEADPVAGEPVVVNVAGNDVIGTVSQVNDDGTADVDYSWNGEDYAKVQSMLRKLRRPARSMAAPPNYEYTQEQNTRKASRIGLPVTAGVHVDAGATIKSALQNIAKDTSLSQMLRAAARALGSTSFDGVDLRVETDGRRRFAGYYLNDEGITEIGLNLRHVGRGKVDAVGTFVHEALHHATLAKVRDPQTDIEKESVEALSKIAQRVRAYAASKELLRRYDYETSNVEEFISALFTRPDFQNFLASIPADFSPKTAAGKFRSVLSEIFRIIAQLVTGQKVQKGSTMEQAITSTLVLFETPQRKIETGPLDSSAASEEMDAEYMAAVESGDMAKAQAMVDAAAREAGYDRKMYHGTTAVETVTPETSESSDSAKNARGKLKELADRFGFDDPMYLDRYERMIKAGVAGITQNDLDNAREWKRQAQQGAVETLRSYEKLEFDVFNLPSGEQELGVHLGNKNAAEMFGSVFPFYTKLGAPVRLKDLGTWNYQSVIREMRKKGVPISQAEYDQVFNAQDNNAALRELLISKGVTSVVYKNEAEGRGDSFIALSPEQIKSADPVTRDAQGNVIPLSQRFNSSSPDIRYSPAAGYRTPAEDLADTAAKMRGEGTTSIPKGMESLLRPQVRGTTSGAKGLGKLFQMNTPAASLDSTYEQAVRGKSTPMVSLEEMFTTAKAQNPSLTEAEFGRQVKQAYDAGMVFLEPAETSAAESKVAQFGVKDSGGFTATGMMMVPPTVPLSMVDEDMAMDAEYMAAVESGDMEKAQKMVDEAAKAAFPKSVVTEPMMSSKEKLAEKPLLKVYHGTDADFNVFERGRKGVTDFGWLGVMESDRHGIFFAENKEFAGTFAKSKGGKRVVLAFLNITNPFGFQDAQDIVESREIGGDFTADINIARWFLSLKDSWEAFDGDSGAIFVKWLETKGYDGAQIQEEGVGLGDDASSQDVWVALRPEQIKSADPVARDAQGNIIPLSQRFNPSSPDIRYSRSSAPSSSTPISPLDAKKALVARFGKEVADKIRIGNFGQLGGRDWDGMLVNGEIAINLNFFSDPKAVIDKVEHEMAHAVWNEPSVQVAWNDLRQSMTPEQQAKLEQEVRDLGYDPSKVDEETLVRFLEQVRASTTPSKWKAFMDAVVDALRRLFGFEPDARTARLAAARIIASAEQAVARGLDPGTDAFSMRETRSRFASPNKDDNMYQVLSQEENDKLANAWIDSLGTMTAAEMLMSGRTPASMPPTVKENIAGTLLQQLTVLSTGPTQTPDQQLVATVMLNRLGRYWTQSISQDPARALQQRAVQNSRLYPIAPILKAEQVLEDRAEKIMQARFTGGTPAAVAGVAKAADNSALDADERVERILQTLIGSLGPKETAQSALAQMFRGKGQRDQIIDEVAQALMVKARGNTVSPERRTALSQLVSSLKSTLSSKVKGEAKAAPESTLPELLTRAFVNQVAEGPMFKQSWDAGREKVLDMLVGLEMDKSYHPAQKNLKDAQERLRYLEAGSEQQVTDSAVERAALKQQIEDIKAEMKSELAAINAMMPELKAQRDSLMPEAVTMAFDPAASKEAITRAFEQAGYTAEIATGLDKSGRRTLSMKDALRDKTRAINAVMNVFDEGMKPLDAATQNEWQKAIPVARKAVEETLNEWQKQADKTAATQLENQKNKLLDENSKPLQQLINKLRGKMFPGMRWGDIFVDLPETQDARAQQLWDRINKHEALQNLTGEERQQLADGINKVWQGEREKAFKKELKRAGLLKEKSVVDRANVFAAAPRLIRLLNLGALNASTFREAVAPHFGLRTLTNEQATKLRQMASEAWKEPEGVLRNRKLRALLDEMQSVTQASWSEIMNGYWTASILSGLRTQFDTYMAVINGFGTNLMQAGAAMVRAKSVTAGVEAHLQWWQGLLQGIKESFSILTKGDTSFLKRFNADLTRALEGENGASPVPIGERMWKEGSIWSKAPALVMIFTGRMMTAADHINNTATTQGAMAVARALHPELYGGRVSFTPEETADARKQAIREALGGREPETFDERRLVNVRTREILNASISEQDRNAASTIGDMAAYQNDPTGFFGAIHSSLKAGLNSIVRKFDDVAQDEAVNKLTRAMMATMAGAMHAITGTRFMRFGFNFGNDIIRYIPGSYLLGPLGFFGRETSPMERDLLIGKNIVGLVLASILGSLFWDDDETKDDEWHIEGDWTSLSPEEQSKRRSMGISPQSMWKRSSKDGSITTALYKQWPTMALFAGVGGMQDERRYKPKEWAERGTAGHLLNMAWNGSLQIQNVSAVRGLGDLFGTSSATSGRSAEALKDKIVGLGVNYTTGLIPTILKDIDKVADPKNYKPEGVLEKLEAAVPLARRFVNDGRPQLNLFGDEVKLNREPWSRLASKTEPLDPAYANFAELRARGHDLQQANTGRQVFKDGKKVPLDSISKELTWKYERAVGQAYKAWMGKDGQKLIEMDVEQADKVIDKVSRDIRDRELKKIQVEINKL